MFDRRVATELAHEQVDASRVETAGWTGHGAVLVSTDTMAALLTHGRVFARVRSRWH